MFFRQSAVINKPKPSKPQTVIDIIARRCAVSIGRRMENSDALTIVRFLKHNDPTIRQEALKVLARFSNQITHPYIGKGLTDTNLFVRIEACRAIGRLKIHTLKEKLYDLLLTKSPLVVCAAAMALAQMGDKKGLSPVAKLVCIRGKHQVEAVNTLNYLTNKRFGLTAVGINEAIKWIAANFRR